ncbi:MAG: hypothetical protein INR73_03535 [Williamsia sp.]|nr:hypothetical protein [Williamsia sp.]
MDVNKLFVCWLLLSSWRACLFPATAQERKPTLLIQKPLNNNPPPKQPDSVAEKDLIDVLSEWRKKPVSKENKTITAKPSFTVVPAVGYTLQSKLVGSLTGNAVFHYNEANISTISAIAGYSQLKQFTMPLESNIWIKQNKLNLVGDFRFYKYPQSTFGLGSGSSVKNEDPMSYSFFRFYEIVLTPVAGNLFAGAGYIFDDHWNIREKGLANGHPSDYALYGKAAHTISSGITLNSVFEKRNNPINPSKGSYINLQYRSSWAALANTTKWQSLIIDMRKYFQFPGRSQNVLALWSYNWLIVKGKPPYLDLPSNSWDSYSSTGRGYIQGRFRGAQMIDAEAEYRFRITRNGLFGAVVFANAESFSALQGSRFQAVQPGAGAGLRIKLNKVSKTNISIDYGFGNQGSHGLFVNMGELF